MEAKKIGAKTIFNAHIIFLNLISFYLEVQSILNLIPPYLEVQSSSTNGTMKMKCCYWFSRMSCQQEWHVGTSLA